MATLLKSKNGLWRVYKTLAARQSAYTQLRNRGKYNYFVFYGDVRGPALQAAHAEWAKGGSVYVNR
jgi:hypothetical protein